MRRSLLYSHSNFFFKIILFFRLQPPFFVLLARSSPLITIRPIEKNKLFWTSFFHFFRFFRCQRAYAHTQKKAQFCSPIFFSKKYRPSFILVLFILLVPVIFCKRYQSGPAEQGHQASGTENKKTRKYRDWVHRSLSRRAASVIPLNKLVFCSLFWLGIHAKNKIQHNHQIRFDLLKTDRLF